MLGSHTHATRSPQKRITRTLARLASHTSTRTVTCRYQNINWLPIDYACRPRLRTRLTQGRQTSPWNPWIIGGRDSHPSHATHACILTRINSTTQSPGSFTTDTTLPYPTTQVATASADNLSPATLSARNHLTSELLRTLSRMAASKPTSWLSTQLHILSHSVTT